MSAAWGVPFWCRSGGRRAARRDGYLVARHEVPVRESSRVGSCGALHPATPRMNGVVVGWGSAEDTVIAVAGWQVLLSPAGRGRRCGYGQNGEHDDQQRWPQLARMAAG